MRMESRFIFLHVSGKFTSQLLLLMQMAQEQLNLFHAKMEKLNITGFSCGAGGFPRNHSLSVLLDSVKINPLDLTIRANHISAWFFLARRNKMSLFLFLLRFWIERAEK